MGKKIPNDKIKFENYIDKGRYLIYYKEFDGCVVCKIFNKCKSHMKEDVYIFDKKETMFKYFRGLN